MSNMDDITNTEMQNVLKHNMKMRVMDVRNMDEYIQSLLRITAYKDHNKIIKDEFKQRIQILDEQYGSYTMWIDLVQISIIVLAAVSSFLQAGDDIIHLSKQTIGFISLIISSYTGLVLALAKYKKIDEKKESINNLRSQCAEYLTQIQCRNDRLNAWCYDKLWAGGNIEKLSADWKAEDELLYNELKPMIERKQNLTCEFERILDSHTVKKLSKIIRERNLKYKTQSIKFTEREDELELQATKLEAEKQKMDNKAFFSKLPRTTGVDPAVPVRMGIMSAPQPKDEEQCNNFVSIDPGVPGRPRAFMARERRRDSALSNYIERENKEYARRQLDEGVMERASDLLYCDTDENSSYNKEQEPLESQIFPSWNMDEKVKRYISEDKTYKYGVISKINLHEDINTREKHFSYDIRFDDGTEESDINSIYIKSSEDREVVEERNVVINVNNYPENPMR